MGNICNKKTTPEYSRFDDNLSDIDIQKIFDEYKGIPFSMKIKSDKYIYVLSSFCNESVQKYPKKIKFCRVESSEIEPEDTCAICLDNLNSGNKLAKLCGCGHIFHLKCIETTLNKCGEICPLCRRGVDYDKIRELEGSMNNVSDSDSNYSYNDDD
jgi:hypothetical protein